MKLKRYGLALAVGLLAISTAAYSAGLFPDFPVVGGATYCAGSSSSATGTITGLQTGCPNQVPAGPSIVTGSEQIPADTRLGSAGAAPQTVLLPMASLNALPITVVGVTSSNPAGFSPSNLVGGVLYNATGTITAANITLPTSPIDGQQFVIGSNFTITTLIVAAPPGTTLSVASPTALTVSGTVPQGFTFMFNAATSKWFKLR